MKRLLCSILGTITAIGLLVCMNPAIAQGPLGVSMGTHQVLVINAVYAHSNAPVTNGTQWCASLNQYVDTYYNAAANGQCRFTFTSAGSLNSALNVIQFPFTYDETAPGESASPIPSGGFGIFNAHNDPVCMPREVAFAIDAVDAVIPGVIGTQYKNIIVVVNGNKRGRALPVFPFAARVSGSPERRIVNLGVTIVHEPTDGNIEKAEISTAAHELGHQIGLPDLYNEKSVMSVLANVPGYSPAEFTEYWDQMAFDNLQNFSGYSRALLGWLPSNHLKQIFLPLVPSDQSFKIYPPMHSAHYGDFELLQIFIDPSSSLVPNEQGISYLVESRTAVPGGNLDTNRLSITPGGALLPGITATTAPTPDNTVGIPTDYDRGVTVAVTKPWFPGLNFPPLNPIKYLPRKENPPLDRSNNRQLQTSAILMRDGDDTITDDETGLSVHVRNIDSNGVATVDVNLSPVPRPDVMPLHCWLDNPSNGFGTYWTPNGPFGDPISFGDPIFKAISVNWISHAPLPSTISISERSVTHRLHFRVLNIGPATAMKVKGTAFLLNPQLPAFTGALTLDAIRRLNPFREIDNIDFGDIAPGGDAHASVDIVPDKPFLVILLLDPTAAPSGTKELDLINNALFGSFVIMQVNPGSPYQAIDTSLQVTNIDAVSHLIYAGPAKAFPYGWTGSIMSSDPHNLFTPLEPGKDDTYTVHLQPADPSRDKPEQIRPIDIYGWMDYADSWVPVSKMQLNAVLSYKTKLTIDVKGAKPIKTGDYHKETIDLSAYEVNIEKLPARTGTAKEIIRNNKPALSVPFTISVTGRLNYITLSHRVDNVIGQPVTVYVYGDDGSKQILQPGSPNYTANTDRNGYFTQYITLRTRVKYVITAKYGGSISYTPSESGSFLYQ